MRGRSRRQLFAFIFDSAGFGEWFVLLAVLLIAVGPRQLPSAARRFGRIYSKICRAAEGFKRQLLELDMEAKRAGQELQREADDAFRIEGDEASAVPAEPPAPISPEEAS